ncbi:hypothetical protein AB4211_09390 [Vibrio lentus]
MKSIDLVRIMMIAKELVPLCRYIRECVVIALGGEPKEWHTDEHLDEFIAQVNGHILSLFFDLIAMLDYLYALNQAHVPLINEESEIYSTARQLELVVRYHKQKG